MQNNNLTNLWESVLHPNIHTAFEALTDADMNRYNSFDNSGAVAAAPPNHVAREVF